jgi:hypothetical protein
MIYNGTKSCHIFIFDKIYKFITFFSPINIYNSNLIIFSKQKLVIFKKYHKLFFNKY